MIAVAEAARNIVCSGGKPLATTDCLNFGSPENPGVMWQFREALKGMGEACKALNTRLFREMSAFTTNLPMERFIRRLRLVWWVSWMMCQNM